MKKPNDKARTIFLGAVEIAAEDDRWMYVEKRCGGDAELRGEVAELLNHHRQMGQFLECPPAGTCATLDQTTGQAGAMIGRYKLLEQVGEGGMGVVYVAEQTEPVRRRVALKIIKPGMDTKQVIARFEAERQALAMMDHPNIAKIFDAGMVGSRQTPSAVVGDDGTRSVPTTEGRPYFVMELVRGMPITEYCDKARLSPRQRLELFIDVCQAVQHAHQKGVIHRDLKPSNVMITVHDGRPVAKVIDFGVAKAVGQQLTERTVYTAHTQLVGTPLYMSPEQADFSSQDVDTRSDVYSLGVLLYELLTGQTPFDKETLTKAGFDEMRRIIREDEPPRPSRRFSTLGAAVISTASQHRGVDERRLSKILCGELDWIVMKALEKDRSRRYESASALAADIQRYLSDEPVLACPPTTMYRFKKFARKHQPAFLTAASIALCLLLGTTVSAWQAVRATTAEAQATANEQKAVTNEQKANASAAQAQERAQEASVQRDEAQKQRDEVTSVNERLVATQHRLERTLYTSNMNLAGLAWEAGNVERTRELLDGHRPKQGETDLRGFEWYYLHRQCYSDQLTLKHSGPVVCIAYSPDGKRLASGGAASEVKIWDARTGKELLTLKGLQNFVTSVAFSPDGKRLAGSSGLRPGSLTMPGVAPKGNVKVWDAESGREFLTLEQSAQCVVFSPDGKQIATASPSLDILQAAGVPRIGAVKLWDALSGKQLRTFPDAGDVHNIAFSPDGQRLAAGISHGAIGESLLPKEPAPPAAIIWDVQTGQRVLTLTGHNSSAHGVAFSPSGERLAGISRGRMMVWNARTGQELLSLQDHPGLGRGVAFSPDGKHLASTSGAAIAMRDGTTGQDRFTLRGHTGIVDAIAFSPDGQHLASASADQTVKIWNAQTGQEPLTLGGLSGVPGNVVFSPDGQRVAAHGGSGNVKVWDAQTGQEVLTVRGGGSFVEFSPDGKRLATGGPSMPGEQFSPVPIKVWDAHSGLELLRLGEAGSQFAFSPNGKYLAAASPAPAGGGVKFWDAQTGKEIPILKGVNGFVQCMAFSPDSKHLAIVAGAYLIRLWNVEGGTETVTLNGHTATIMAVTFSPDGKRLASASLDKTVKIWDTQTGQEILTLKGRFTPIECVAFSPDGKRLATGSLDTTVTIWDVESGAETLTLKGHTESVWTVAFSPDGHRLASRSWDQTVRIWDVTPVADKTVQDRKVAAFVGLPNLPRNPPSSKPWPWGWNGRRFLNNQQQFLGTPGVESGVDNNVRHGGEASGFINVRSKQPNKRFQSMDQYFRADAYRGQRLRLSAYIKTEKVEGAAQMFLWVDGQSESLASDDMDDRPITGTTDWKKYEIVLDVPAESINISFGFQIEGTGQMWFDDIQFDVVGQEIPATKSPGKGVKYGDFKVDRSSQAKPVNLDFETVVVAMSPEEHRQGLPDGWYRFGTEPSDYKIGLDENIKHGGKASGFIEPNGDVVTGNGELGQACQAGQFRGKRVRMSAYLKADRVENGSLRVSIVSANQTSVTQRLTGTFDWTRHEFVFDVPMDAVNLNFEVELDGQGRLWADDFQFEIVDSDVPATEGANSRPLRGPMPRPVSQTKPLNLDFEK